MSVAIISSDGGTTSSSNLFSRRQITSLLYNEGSIVQNFKTADDTFELTSGTYRFDATYTSGMKLAMQARENRGGGYQAVIYNETLVQQVSQGIASVQFYDTSQFLVSGLSGYLVGTASSISVTGDYIVYTNHQLGYLDDVFFLGTVPGGITAGATYSVVFTGIASTDQPNRFKVIDSNSNLVDLTGSLANTPTIYKKLTVVPSGDKIDYRPTSARYRVIIPVGAVYKFSIQAAGVTLFDQGIPHRVTATIGGVTVPSRYLTLRITKTN